jgi:hypothetical protein
MLNKKESKVICKREFEIILLQLKTFYCKLKRQFSFIKNTSDFKTFWEAFVVEFYLKLRLILRNNFVIKSDIFRRFFICKNILKKLSCYHDNYFRYFIIDYRLYQMSHCVSIPMIFVSAIFARLSCQMTRATLKVMLHGAIFLATCNAILLLSDVILRNTSLHYTPLMYSQHIENSSLISLTNIFQE